MASSLSATFSALGNQVFSRRLYLGLCMVPLGALLIRPRHLFGNHETLGTAVSLGLVLLGLALRAWAGGSAGGHTRTTSIEAPRLATAGPYAYVRNPIYLGSIVLGIGMVGLLGDPWMLVLCAAAFTFLYVSIVPAEERFLRGEFGAEYERYCAEVPRLLPRLSAWKGATPTKFNWHTARGEAHIAFILVAIYLFLRGVAWLTAR